MHENEISGKIIGAAINIHKTLGPGLLESVYETTLAYDLNQMGLMVRRQVPMPLVYRQVRMRVGFRIDLIVENKVLIEIKSLELLAPVHFSQTLTYLKLSGLKVGLLINFNTNILMKGVHRLVNRF